MSRTSTSAGPKSDKQPLTVGVDVESMPTIVTLVARGPFRITQEKGRPGFQIYRNDKMQDVYPSIESAVATMEHALATLDGGTTDELLAEALRVSSRK